MALHSSMEATEWAVYVETSPGAHRIIGRVRLAYVTAGGRLFDAEYRLPTGRYLVVGTYASKAGARSALARRYERRMAGTIQPYSMKPAPSVVF